MSEEQGGFNSGHLTLKNGHKPGIGDEGWEEWREGKGQSGCKV